MQWLTGLPEVERWTHGKFLCCNAGLWVGGGGSCCCMFYACLWATLDSRLTIPHSWTLCNPLVQDLQLALHALMLLRNARLLLLSSFTGRMPQKCGFSSHHMRLTKTAELFGGIVWQLKKKSQSADWEHLVFLSNIHYFSGKMLFIYFFLFMS